MRMAITIERHPVDGFSLTGWYRGEYYRHRYIFYTLAEAKAEFREYVKAQDSKIIRGIR